jgi:hypothetical protein
LRRIRLVPPRATLTADTDSGSVVLSTLGTPAEREAAAAALIDELRLDAAGEPATLPGDWSEIIDREGVTAIVPDPRIRRLRARITAILALCAATVAALLVRGSLQQPTQAGFAVIVTAIAAALVWAAMRMARVHDEWRCQHGELRLRRRSGTRVRELFAAEALELTRSEDSDGDAWYTLEALAPRAHADRKAKAKRTLVRSLHDPAEPAQLGRYLALRTGLPFEDRSKDERGKIDFDALKAQLRARGRLGRFAARWIELVEQRRKDRETS